MNLVSIIIPVYNASAYLDRCVKSLLQQTYKNLEIIFINDGSKDNSLQLLLEYKKIDNRIIVINQNNMGVSAARNAGLNICTGEWVAFVDIDDWIDNNYIECLLEMGIRDNLDIVQCGRIDEKDDGSFKISPRIQKNYQIINFDDFIPTEALFYGTSWGYLISKKIIGKTKFDINISFAEDALFTLECLSKSNRIGLISQCLYHYNLTNHASLSQGKFDKKKFSLIDSRKKQLKLLCNPEAVRIMSGRLADACYMLFTIGKEDKNFMKHYYSETNNVFIEYVDQWFYFKKKSGVNIRFKFIYRKSLKWGYFIHNLYIQIKNIK